MKKLILAAVLCTTAQLSIAAPSINDMQGCQGLLDFIDQKLDTTAQYPTDKVDTVRKGLDGYNTFIQDTIVSPGLLAYTGGDKAKADALQKQVDDYKATLVVRYNKRYPQKRLFADQAISVNECAKKSVPAGAALEDLKASLNMILELAKLP